MMTYKHNPKDIFKSVLIPLLEGNGFKLTSSEIDDNRYITTHQFRRRTPNRPPYMGQSLYTKIDVVGIPMGSVILIVHAIICDSNRDSVKIKLKMSDTISCIKDRLMNEFVIKLIELLSISINDLPIELKITILSLLPIESLFKMALVSSLWRDIALHDELWRILVKRQFPDFYTRRIDGESWKYIYKEAYRGLKLSERRRSWATRGLPSSMIFPALPPSPPRLPIAGPPYLPMLPPPPAYFRDLIPEEVAVAFPHIRRNSISRPVLFPNLGPNFHMGF